jgi:CubicO group peptidase (beta-lactamase class C family)
MTALELIDRWSPPTTAAAIVGPGGVIAARGPVDQPFQLASVTKPLAALATLVAVEEGALDLSSPADDSLLPGATIRHLLAHASGIAPDMRMRVSRPGARRIYSNVGFDLLGERVEAAVGMPFDSYLAEAVVTPLQLRHTVLHGSPAKDGWASASDLTRVIGDLLAPSALLHASTIADATNVQFPGLSGVVPGFGRQDRNDWGLGFEMRDDKAPHWTGRTNSPATYGHFGQSGTMFWVDPVARIGLVSLSDLQFDKWAAKAWPQLSDEVLAETAS